MSIKGGYYIKARCIQESEIAHSSPAVREIWDWLLMNARFTDEKYNGFVINRGQLFCSYSDIREGLSWYVGYRKEMYSESVTKHAMNSLRRLLMITTTKEPRGVIVTICNYSLYQDASNYERTTNEPANEPRTNQPRPSINKEGKERKNKARPIDAKEVEDYGLTIDYHIDGNAFIDNYETNGWVRGKAQLPIKDWKACVRTWKKNNFNQPVPNQQQPSLDLAAMAREDLANAGT